jgi:hypothetical protein
MTKVNDIQTLGLQIQEKEERLVQINEEFNKLIQQSKYFEEYQRLDSELKQFRKEFDKAAIKFLKQTNQKTSEGPAGKITLAVRNSYKVKDTSKLPEEFKELPELEKRVKEMNSQIKQEFELFKNEIPGIEHTEKEYIVWTKPKMYGELNEE